jgi:HK97 family phage major capsid protein
MAELTITDQVVSLKKSLGDKATNVDFIRDKAKTEGRSLTEGEQKDINKIIDDQEAIDKEIRTLERIETSHKFIREPSKIEGDPEKRGIEYQEEPKYSIGEYLKDIAFTSLKQKRGIVDFKVPARLELHQRKAVQELRAYSGVNETIGGEGGFLVGTDFSQTLFQRVYASSSLAGRCRQAVISSNSNSISIPCIDETTRANGSRSGGVYAYWVAEGGQATAKKPLFGRINLTLNKIMALGYATDESINDSGYLETVLVSSLQEEISFMVQDAIYRGDGSGKPLGVLNAPCLVTVAAETGQDADSICAENVLKMYTAMYTSGKQNFIWVMNDEAIPQLVLLSSEKFPNVTFFTTAGGLVNSPTDTLLGKPVIYTEQASALGDVGDIMACDFSQYQLANKGNVQTASSADVAFLTDEMCYRVTFRIDGQPLWKSAVTPYKGSQTRSPFIALAAR